MEQEILKYFKETGFTIDDIKDVFKKYNELRCAVIRVQHEINDSNKNQSIDDVKMEIFKLWHLASLEKEYQE